jgi:hypothetical protein
MPRLRTDGQHESERGRLRDVRATRRRSEGRRMGTGRLDELLEVSCVEQKRSKSDDHSVFHVTQAGGKYIKDRAIVPRAFLAKGEHGRANRLDARVRDHARWRYCKRNRVEPFTKEWSIQRHIENIAVIRMNGEARVLAIAGREERRAVRVAVTHRVQDVERIDLFRSVRSIEGLDSLDQLLGVVWNSSQRGRRIVPVVDGSNDRKVPASAAARRITDSDETADQIVERRARVEAQSPINMLMRIGG